MSGARGGRTREGDRDEDIVMFELGMLVIRARRIIRASVVQRLESLGESMGEWPILSHLARLGPSSQRDLAAAIACDPATVCRALDEMEQRGLVERTRDETDRRRHVVDLTRQGRQKYDRLLPEVGRSMGEVLSQLSERDREQLERVLKKVLQEA